MKRTPRKRPAPAPARPSTTWLTHPERLVPPRAAPWLALGVPLIAALLVHMTAVRTFFAQDDVTFLSRASGLAPTPWTLARPLSEGVTWHLLFAMFRLNPVPYHLFTLGLHLANTAMVFAIGRRLTGSTGAAWGAAILFGTSSIAFTAVHWTSCLVELQVTAFALLSFLFYLRAREAASLEPPSPGASAALLALSAISALAAMLSKESAILLPAVFLVVDQRAGLWPRKPGTVILPALATLGYAAAFVITIRSIKYVGTEAYAMTASPAFIAKNLATYLRWLVTIQNPVRDMQATAQASSMTLGALTGLAGAAMIAAAFRSDRHPEEVGAAWFFAFLIPVVPLLHHTYLYYLYLPWAGACWAIASAARRAMAFAPMPLAWTCLLALAGFVAIEAHNARQREHQMAGVYLADPTIRSSQLLRNMIHGMDSLSFAPGTRIAFLNPAPRRHQSLVGGGGTVVYSYLPFETALRNGETMKLFEPRVTVLGISDRMPREWEDAEIVGFAMDGRLKKFGTGGVALTELGYELLPLTSWTAADSMFRRARELGDTLPDGTFGLMVTSHYLGRTQEMQAFCREFLRRWPNEHRAAIVDTALHRSLRGAPMFQ
ncbi:MAG TPA: hypothetical protein VL123_03740 [Candidatus Udaeobacter sp.]|nr:hypothetical protein [Candidatus Udaeobacter sp.]